MFWSLKDDAIASQLHREATGITRWAISSRNIKNTIFSFPPYDEQKEIVEFIEQLNEKTKAIKHKIEKQIETLKSYRKSLIHECVTGKKQIFKGEINTE